ncbi:hypothetical protein ABDK00_012225 [Niabella insulamsoli]|uniref:hypothetical protein n=1 Tax=Niabella insulamsoli TaxID=3144874 RepID=UPI0031FCC606
MKIKFLLVAFLALVSITGKSQNNSVDATLVKIGGDTLRGKMMVYPTLFSKNQINEISFIKTVQFENNQGDKKIKIKAPDIQSLSFVDFTGEPRRYINNGRLLQRLMYDGKTKWLRRIAQNLYDGSLVYNERFVSETGEVFDVKFDFKKKLKALTQQKPELADEIEKMKLKDDAILNILRKYDSD